MTKPTGYPVIDGILESIAPKTPTKHDCIDAQGNATGLFCPACASEREVATTCNCGSNHAHQRTDYPVSTRLRTVAPVSCHNKTIPIGTMATVTSHCDDGRAWVFFDGYPEGHTFHAPDSYLRVESSPQPPSDSDGEWRYVEVGHGAHISIGKFRLSAHWQGLADSGEIRDVMKQIVSDHAAIPKLVDVLNLFLAMDNCNYELETMRSSGLFKQIHEALDSLGERGKRHQTAPAITTTRKGG